MSGWRLLRRLAWTPLASKIRETKEPKVALRGKWPLGYESFPRRYYPDRVRGCFSAPHLVEHPCFNNTIETFRAWGWQMGALDGAARAFLGLPLSHRGMCNVDSS